MTFFGDVFIAVATIANHLLGIYIWVIIIAALISWVNPDPYNPIVRFLYSVTDPVLRPIRRYTMSITGSLPIDISPIIVIVIITFFRMTVIKALIRIGYSLGGG
jgi:YggT family protein